MMKNRSFRIIRYAYMARPTLLVALMVSMAFTAVSQSMPAKPKAKANVRLANEDGKNIQVKTLLANPKLVSAKSSCEVTGFTISFLPEGGEIYGPFKTEGAVIKEKQIGYIKAHATENVKIFIEDIHMSCNGKEVIEMPIVVTIFP